MLDTQPRNGVDWSWAVHGWLCNAVQKALALANCLLVPGQSFRAKVDGLGFSLVVSLNRGIGPNNGESHGKEDGK